MRKIPLIGLFCLLVASVLPVHAQTAGDDDELLQLLRTELKRNYDSLRTATYPPYFMAYRVHKSETHRVSANFGHIYDNSVQTSVFLTIELRVGKPETDNFHYLDKQSFTVKQVPLPLDENPALVRKILQRETERAYKESVLQYADNLVKATLFGHDSAEVFRFQPMDMDQYYEPPVSEDHWDADDWAARLRHCTSDASLSPHVTEASAEIIYQVNRNYLVNSENSFAVQNHTEARLNLHIGSLTDDNTTEHLDFPYFAPLPEQLPDADVMESYFSLMEDYMAQQICDAPVMENKDCPVWLSGLVASTLMHNLIGHAMENPDNGLFAGKLHQKVIPENFSIISDPLKETWNFGYTFDDEGVKSQRTTLINHGVLERFLSTRTQRTGAYAPNGHARGNLGLPSARQSTLFVRVDSPLNEKEWSSLFANELKRQNLEYGIFVANCDIICDTAKEIITIYPTRCYRIYANGDTRAVRGVCISASPQQWLDNLMAGGPMCEEESILCHSQGDELLQFRHEERDHQGQGQLASRN